MGGGASKTTKQLDGVAPGGMVNNPKPVAQPSGNRSVPGRQSVVRRGSLFGKMAGLVFGSENGLVQVEEIPVEQPKANKQLILTDDVINAISVLQSTCRGHLARKYFSRTTQVDAFLAYLSSQPDFPCPGPLMKGNAQTRRADYDLPQAGQKSPARPSSSADTTSTGSSQKLGASTSTQFGLTSLSVDELEQFLLQRQENTEAEADEGLEDVIDLIREGEIVGEVWTDLDSMLDAA